MKTIKKNNTIIYLITLMLLCNVRVWAQTGRDASTPVNTSTYRATTHVAGDAVVSTDASVNLEELHSLNMALQKAKAELEMAQQKKLSKKEIADRQAVVASTEVKLNALLPNANEKNISSQKNAVAGKAINEPDEVTKRSTKTDNSATTVE